MEITSQLQLLYRHWDKHTLQRPQAKSLETVDKEVYNQIIEFITERMNIWERKENNNQKPFADDYILSSYRFCNIYRELDKQTIQFHTILQDIKDDMDLWILNMSFCRFVCNPQTILSVGLLSFDGENNKAVFNRLISLDSPKFGSFYVFPVSLIMKSEYPTREQFFCFYLPKIMKSCAKQIRTLNNALVVDALSPVCSNFGFNFKFHWTEILIDVAYQYPTFINLFDKFPIGPGSMPTMKMLNSSIDSIDVCNSLPQYPSNTFPYLELMGKPIALSTENWEGIGCEYRKYCNLKIGLGRKRTYAKKSH